MLYTQYVYALCLVCNNVSRPVYIYIYIYMYVLLISMCVSLYYTQLKIFALVMHVCTTLLICAFHAQLMLHMLGT
jgi:hypothetical protein